MKRISITGPESTGKSWLAEQLAWHYHTAWVPEYAREYLTVTAGTYQYEDILKIAQGQMAQEAMAARKDHPMLFCDTDLLVTRIWSDVRFGKVHPWIEEQMAAHRYDLYLLCNVDLPWEYDPLREHPDRRQDLFNQYHALLEELKFPYAIVSGLGEQRLASAIRAVETML